MGSEGESLALGWAKSSCVLDGWVRDRVPYAAFLVILEVYRRYETRSCKNRIGFERRKRGSGQVSLV